MYSLSCTHVFEVMVDFIDLSYLIYLIRFILLNLYIQFIQIVHSIEITNFFSLAMNDRTVAVISFENK